MKLFCREEIRALEERSEQAGSPLAVLMENAGKAVAEELKKRCSPLPGKRAVILCGKGNNGGDGFVCARYLTGWGVRCTVLLVQGEPKTELSRSAFLQMGEGVEILCTERQRARAEEAVCEAEILVDAVYGFSFLGELSGDPAQFLALANEQNGFKLAVDLPSGTECDTAWACPGAFRADVTVTFTVKKPANCSYPAKEFCGETVVYPVGVPSALTDRAETHIFETARDFPVKYLQVPGVQSNKGNLGKLLLVCGSCGMAGACMMAARAALRCGVGLLNIAADRELYPLLAQAVPEAVFTVLDWAADPVGSEKKLRAALDSCTACLVGCGLGDMAETLCPVVFSHCTKPLLADADAINFLARHPEMRKYKGPLVLTPHPGEMARLCGVTIPEIQADRLEAAQKKAEETGAVVVLKGAATVIASPEKKCAVNPTGNAGMAKGGSGDVLAGMTASFLAQGISAFEAAVLGAYLHGLAGDLCAEELTQRAMLPTDLPDMLPRVFRTLHKGANLLK